MDNLKKRVQFFILIFSHFMTYPAYYTQPNPTAQDRLNSLRLNTPQNTAQRLTNESYITPEMQWEILTLLEKDSLAINRQTGEIQDIPSPEQLLQFINQKIVQPITVKEKEILKNALHTMLEATEIALFVAKIEATFDGTALDDKFDGQIIGLLNNQKKSIQNLIKTVGTLAAINETGQQNSYFSWMWSSSSTANNKNLNIDQNSIIVPFQETDAIVTIPADFMPTIIKNNDYKSMPDTPSAANILFKECFIAQQHHLKDEIRINQIKVRLQNPITATNYIYTNFPNFYEICQLAQSIGIAGGGRYNLQAPLAQEHLQAHQLLLHTRQALQTALYIANKKSGVNVGYLLPASVSSYLDGIINELLQYDNFIAPLCKDPQYGATLQDIEQSSQWSTITMIAAGVVVTGVTLTALYWFGFNPVTAATKTIYNALPSMNTFNMNKWWNGSNAQAQASTSGDANLSPNTQTQGWFSGWWPSSNSNQNKTSQLIGPKQEDSSLVTNTLQSAAYYGSQAVKLAGVVSLATKGAQIAHSMGVIQLDPVTKEYIDKANQISMIGGAFSGSVAGIAGASLGVIGGDWKTLFGIYDIVQSGGNAYAAGKGVVQIGQHIIYQIVGQSTNPQNQTAQYQKTPVLEEGKFLPPQNIYNGITTRIDACIDQGVDPLPSIAQGIATLLQNKLTTPDQLIFVLQNIEQRYAQIPALAENIAGYIERIAAASAKVPVDTTQQTGITPQ